MKRLVLCAVAVLLASGALMSRPTYACTVDPACASEGCEGICGPAGGTCNFCTGHCNCA
jgi:hypothetical protein